MKIGTRVTLLTVLLVVLTLGLYGLFSVRTRRSELTQDLERQTQLLGSSLQVALEAALRDGLFEDVRRLVSRMRETDQPIHVVYLDLIHPADSAAFGGDRPRAGSGPGSGPGSGIDKDGQDDEPPYPPPPRDPTREARLRRVQIDGKPYGEHVEIGGRPLYAYMVPLRGSQHRLVAVVDLTRDEGDMLAALHAAQRDVALTVALLSALLALLVGFTVRQAFSAPLLRLVDGIDEVTRGDYTGAILRERNDEVGTLADRFNEMTRSLRQAREQILAGVDAKLQLEMRLRHSDKLATIGQLAASIAHEVGTPLNVIGGRARAMARHSDDPQAVRKNAEIIAAQAERITKIIQQLLDYARRKAPARSRVDLQHVAAVTLDFLEHQLTTGGVHGLLHPFEMAPPGAGVRTAPAPVARDGVKLAADLSPDSRRPDSRRDAAPFGRVEGRDALPFGHDEGSGEVPLPPPAAPVVIGDADQLQQVCLNLCLNAIQAMPQGGTLEMSLLGLVRRRPGLDRTPPGAYVMLSVADTGVGIPAEDRERIFEPFYSTKGAGGDRGEGPGGGSGLGLSVSAGIVKDHDGWIEIESRPGGGTVFRVYLPAPELDDEELNDHGAATTQPEQARTAPAAGVAERAS